MPIIPNQENLVTNNSKKEVYYFFDAEGKRICKTKELYKDKKIIALYPVSIRWNTGQVTPKKIKVLELRGWDKIEDLPKDFKKVFGYGFSSLRIKQFNTILYGKFREIEKLVIGINIQTKFSKKTISFNWGDLEQILVKIDKEKFLYDRSRKVLTNNLLAKKTAKFSKIERKLTGGDLEYFLNKYDSFDKISTADVSSLTRVLSEIPISKITSTTHIIHTKEKIEIAFLDDIIKDFETLLKSKEEKEEKWQRFFEKHTWTLNHLFPYEVILRKGKAYVGGKTIENEEGRIVDFLFETELKDNFALLEIKTPQKQLLKNSPYRAPEVFSISDELSGGVNQCLDQKDTFLRDYGKELKPLDPKAILVIGLKKNLTSEQSKCFELYRANQKNIDIVTFDELHSKLVGLHSVITGVTKKI